MKKKFDLKLELNADSIEKLSDKMSEKIIGGFDGGETTAWWSITTSKITSACDNASQTFISRFC